MTSWIIYVGKKCHKTCLVIVTETICHLETFSDHVKMQFVMKNIVLVTRKKSR